MAYTHPNLQRVGPANSDYPTIWTYKTADTAATVDTTGYFNAAAEDLTVGDLIYALTGVGGTLAYMLYPVVSIAAGVVDLSDGTALVVTDTD